MTEGKLLKGGLLKGKELLKLKREHGTVQVWEQRP
jgi:hypothetical protein